MIFCWNILYFVNFCAIFENVDSPFMAMGRIYKYVKNPFYEDPFLPFGIEHLSQLENKTSKKWVTTPVDSSTIKFIGFDVPHKKEKVIFFLLT